MKSKENAIFAKNNYMLLRCNVEEWAGFPQRVRESLLSTRRMSRITARPGNKSRIYYSYPDGHRRGNLHPLIIDATPSEINTASELPLFNDFCEFEVYENDRLDGTTYIMNIKAADILRITAYDNDHCFLYVHHNEVDVSRYLVRYGLESIYNILIGGSTTTGEDFDWSSYWATQFDYFVDATDGSDDNNGTSPDTPWKTIAKINAGAFNAGDRIGLRAGRVWRETLIMPSSGTEEAPIVIGKYDTGDDPIIDGTDLIGDFVIAELSPNVDFETGITGWSGGDLSWQEAAIGGRTNVAKITASGTGNRYISAAVGMAGTPHTLSFDVYIPSSNITVNTVRIREGSASYIFVGYITPTQDEWVHYELEWSANAANTLILIYLTNAPTNTNCTIGDIIYIDNISITPSASYYEKTVALITPSQVYNDNEVITRAANAAVANNQWYFTGTKLLVRDDNGVPSAISATIRNYALTTNNKAWIDINDINVRLGNYKRFQDNFLENIASSIDYAIEPSALVSPDGNRLDLWVGGPNGYTYYLYSTDGISFSVPQPVISDQTLHRHILLVGNTYYYYAGSLTGKRLYTSTDRINYIDQGVVLSPGSSGEWDDVGVGNVFVFKEGNNWYMLYDASGGSGYQIGLATSLDGVNWTKYGSNPVLTYTGGAGNPELVRVNNDVIKHDGKYYLYYMEVATLFCESDIRRAYSEDLINWIDEGPILNNRCIHDTTYRTYHDHCLTQFKGKSYLFFTPSNQGYGGGGMIAHIDCVIDNRTLAEMIALTP